MTADEHSIGRAAAVRDAATGRIRRTTTTVVALAAGLTAAFTAVAASSTHLRQHVVRSPQTRRTKQSVVIAPAPALVPVAGRSDGASPTPSPSSSAAPAPAPAPVAVPPVVSSGGS
jgi:hypothetical protein